MKLPYGLADFRRLITEGYVYVDRTRFIPVLEMAGSALLFVRPRRFGKSLWLQTLRAYYDLRLEPEFERLFGHLAIGAAPTPLRNRFFVMAWNFSLVDATGDVETIRRRLNAYVNHEIETFLSEHRGLLPEPVKIEPDAVLSLGNLLAAIRQTLHRLYLLIDEYDNFANELMVADESRYGSVVRADGPFKPLLKAVKWAMEGQGLERLFITGVSPVVLSDLTSGLNICRNVYLEPELNELCGFGEIEVAGLLASAVGELRARTHADVPAVEKVLEVMKTWYDGYRFAPEVQTAIYNPTLVLSFLQHFLKDGRFPRQLLDTNLAVDEEKLRHLGKIAAGQRLIVEALQTAEPIEVSELRERFSLADLLDREQQDQAYAASYLYYFGLLTLVGETERRKLLLAPPNLVVRTLYAQHVRRWLVPAEPDRHEAEKIVEDFLAGGEIGPLARFFERKILAVFSNRDYRWMNELALKAAWIAFLFDDRTHVMASELELGRGHADLCLLRRGDLADVDVADFLFELKYVPLETLGLGGAELRRYDERQLSELRAVRSALDHAMRQLEGYRAASLEMRGNPARLRSFAIVAVGFERLVTIELEQT